jgi:hypothetical protein
LLGCGESFCFRVGLDDWLGIGGFSLALRSFKVPLPPCSGAEVWSTLTDENGEEGVVSGDTGAATGAVVVEEEEGGGGGGEAEAAPEEDEEGAGDTGAADEEGAGAVAGAGGRGKDGAGRELPSLSSLVGLSWDVAIVAFRAIPTFSSRSLREEWRNSALWPGSVFLQLWHCGHSFLIAGGAGFGA